MKILEIIYSVACLYLFTETLYEEGKDAVRCGGYSTFAEDLGWAQGEFARIAAECGVEVE